MDARTKKGSIEEEYCFFLRIEGRSSGTEIASIKFRPANPDSLLIDRVPPATADSALPRLFLPADSLTARELLRNSS
jgi:hypothetical protein